MNLFEASRNLFWIPGLFLFSYLAGGIPFGLFIARVFHVPDIRTKGSGNIGASNVSRVVGFWPAGALTFILDFLKGVVPVFLATPTGVEWVAGFVGVSGTGGFQPNLALTWATGFFAILGHCYSPFLNFRGGKGVATGFGVILALSPLSALFGILGFVFTFFYKRIASLASVAGLFTATFAYLICNPMEKHLWIGAAILFLILMRHERNIDALLQDREEPIEA